VPLDDILETIADESDREMIQTLVERNPSLGNLVEAGETLQSLDPRIRDLGYEGKPEGAVSELERWREWLSDDKKGWEWHKADKARVLEALAESMTRVDELEVELRRKTTAQKIVVWVGVFLIVAAGLYPPWVSLWGTSGGLRKPVGYYWLFEPPKEGFVTLDIPRLLVEWALIAVFCAGLLWAGPVRKRPWLIGTSVVLAASIVAGAIRWLPPGDIAVVIVVALLVLGVVWSQIKLRRK
jgi:hypothetical protein